MKRYIGYLAIFGAIIAGYKSFPAFIIILLALGMTILFAKDRIQVDKNQARAAAPNPVLDGIYMLAVQVMVMFVAYMIGYFAVSPAGDSFIAFLSGGR